MWSWYKKSRTTGANWDLPWMSLSYTLLLGPSLCCYWFQFLIAPPFPSIIPLHFPSLILSHTGSCSTIFPLLPSLFPLCLYLSHFLLSLYFPLSISLFPKSAALSCSTTRVPNMLTQRICIGVSTAYRHKEAETNQAALSAKLTCVGLRGL